MSIDLKRGQRKPERAKRFYLRGWSCACNGQSLTNPPPTSAPTDRKAGILIMKKIGYFGLNWLFANSSHTHDNLAPYITSLAFRRACWRSSECLSGGRIGRFYSFSRDPLSP